MISVENTRLCPRLVNENARKGTGKVPPSWEPDLIHKKEKKGNDAARCAKSSKWEQSCLYKRSLIRLVLKSRGAP